MGRYTKEPTDTTSNDTSHRLKKALHKSGGTKFDRYVGLGGVARWTVKELDSESTLCEDVLRREAILF